MKKKPEPQVIYVEREAKKKNGCLQTTESGCMVIILFACAFAWIVYKMVTTP